MDVRSLNTLLGAQFQYVASQGIFSLNGNQEEGHTNDSVQEKHLEEILVNASDLSSDSDELQSSIRGLFSEYHLSSKRARLLSAFDYAESVKEVLEVGCGCGVISRCLGELMPGARIISVEENMRRAGIAALRTRDLTNVHAVSASYYELRPRGSFDLVACIGFLEYAPMYFRAGNPFQKALELMHDALDSGGTLLLAIENQFGLKYLIGHSEDHTDLAFEGVQGYPRTGGNIRTFGRADLTRMLKESGFRTIEYFYPVPDHKLTEAIFSESILSGQHDVSSVVAGYKSRSYGNPAYTPICDEQLAWLELGRNRLIPQYANSFFVIAGKQEERAEVTASWEAISFATKRSRRFWNMTLYKGFDTGTPIKTRIQLYPEASRSDGVLRFPMKQESSLWIEGENLLLLIKKQLAKDEIDTQGLVELLQKWVGYLISHQEEDAQGVISGRYLEAIPQNLVLDRSGEIVFVDDEWEWDEDLEIKTVVLRGLYGVLLSNRRALERHRYLGRGSKLGFLRYMCEVLAGRVKPRDWYHFIRVHIGIWKELRGRPWYAAPIVITGNILLSERFIELLRFLALSLLQRHDAFRPVVIRLRDLIS